MKRHVVPLALARLKTFSSLKLEETIEECHSLRGEVLRGASLGKLGPWGST